MNTFSPEAPKRKRVTLLASLLLCMATSQQAFSANSDELFHMMAIEDQAKGALITEQKFAEAIEKISTIRERRRSFAAHTNLCVAYVKLKRAEEARKSCEAAVAAREGTSRKKHWYPLANSGGRLFDRDRAVALSNRGVLRALTGDLDGAQADFEMSASITNSLDATRTNLAKLASRIDSDAVASTTQ